MADVFISYSKDDRPLAVRLSAFLEAQGYSTWWDDHLDTAAPYRDRIMAELRDARAVVVIWTDNSVASDWVRAEAGRALQQKKLLPVRSSDVSYEVIPLPFGELHTTDIADEAAVLSALERQINSPIIQPTAVSAIFTKARYELILWAGIVGGALTLVSNVEGLLTLSKAVRWVISNWVGLLQSVWNALFFFQFKPSGYDAVFLTIFVLVAISIIYSCNRKAPSETVARRRGRLALYFALLVIGLGLSSSFSAVSSQKIVRSWKGLDAYVDALFRQDPHCRQVVSEFAHRYLTPGTTARIISGSMNADEVKDLTLRQPQFDSCVQQGNVDSSKLRELVIGTSWSQNSQESLWRDDDQRPSVALTVYETASKHDGLPRLLLRMLLFLPLALPFCMYAVARYVFSIRLDVDVLSIRLWRMIIGAVLVVAFNYIALLSERHFGADESGRSSLEMSTTKSASTSAPIFDIRARSQAAELSLPADALPAEQRLLVVRFPQRFTTALGRERRVTNRPIADIGTSVLTRKIRFD